MQIERSYELAGRSEANAIVEWRQAQLLGAGLEPFLAASVAAQADIDIHALIELVERGCPPPLAVRILAPIGVQVVEHSA
jgi:hypothetical protein